MTSFYNRKRAKQLIDFGGLQWNKMRPTDLDLSVDWGQDTFVFVEIKGINAGLTIGQQIHLEGLVKAIRAGGKKAYAIVAKHQTRASEDIMAQDCMVSSVYDGNLWEKQLTSLDLGRKLNELYNEHNERKTK